MDEAWILQTLLRPRINHPGALALMDDAAILSEQLGRRYVISTDSSLAGIHLPFDPTPERCIDRALGSALSDLAAMGARPYAFLIALQLPSGCGTAFLQRLVTRLDHWQHRSGAALIGGDLVCSPIIGATVTVIGTVIDDVETGIRVQGSEQALLRSNLRPGDGLYVTGTIGDSALALLLEQGCKPPVPLDEQALLARLACPEPRLETGMQMAGLAHGAIDLSDGLILDAERLAEASQVTLSIELDQIPLSPDARRWLEADSTILPILLGGGDDYELLIAGRATVIDKLIDRLIASDDPAQPRLPGGLKRIGTVEPFHHESGSRVRFMRADGTVQIFAKSGYQHQFGT